MSMTKRYFTLLLTLLLVSPLARAASAQTADDVVQKYLNALGGRAALEKLTSRRSTGTVSLSTNPGGDLNGTVEVVVKAPNKSRALMTLDLSAAGGGKLTIEQRFDGATGITLNSMQGPTDITGNQLDNMRNSIFPSPLLHAQENGMRLEMRPSEKVDGKNAVVMLSTPKTGSPVKMYFDPDTTLLTKTVATLNSPQLGGNIEQTTTFSDYRTVDGVKVPFKVVNANTLQTLTITFSKVENNVAVDDAMFVKK